MVAAPAEAIRALASRRGRKLRDDPLGEPVLRAVLARTGWRLERYQDAPHRFLALAVLTR